MSSLKELSQGRSDILKINPKDIKIKDGWNQREEGNELTSHIDTIAQSIITIGFMPSKPVEVYMEGGEMFVSDGHCRLRGTMRAIEHYKADIKTIPVINVAKANDADRMLSQIVSNSGKPLTVFEQAKVYDKLIKYGWTAADIATKVGKSPAHISQSLDMLTLPEKIKYLVLTGKVSVTLAAKVFKECGEDTEAAYNQLTEAVQTAEGEGRTRAMPKDMGERKPTPRKVLKDALEGADIIQPEGDDGMVLIRMTMETWEEIASALKLDIELRSE